jgi:hypothetical protein
MAGVALHPRLDVLEAEGCLESLGAVSLLDTKDPESSSGRRGLYESLVLLGQCTPLSLFHFLNMY